MDDAAALQRGAVAHRAVPFDFGRFAAAWSAALIGWVQVLPALIAAWSVAMYVSSADAPGQVAVVGGLVAGMCTWLVLGLITIPFAGADRSNRSVYDDVVRRIRAVDAQLARLKARDGALYERAQQARDHVVEMLGLENGSSAASGSQWVQGTGYIDLWAAIHSAEEALLGAADDTELITMAFTDRARLRSSRIDARDDLLLLSGSAITTLNQSAGASLPAPPPARFAGSTGTRLARTVLQEVRRAINAYRHDRAAGLVRLKRQLVQTTALTGLVGAVGVGLALLTGVSADVVRGAAAFWVVGALTGFFQSAYTQQRSQYAVEDYGLAGARMLLAPYLAGIAAVFGVFMVAFVAGPPLGYDLLHADSAVMADALRRIFDVTANPIGFLLAAVFGLTPELIIGRLQSIGEQLKLDIQSTEATTGQGRGTAD